MKNNKIYVLMVIIVSIRFSTALASYFSPLLSSLQSSLSPSPTNVNKIIIHTIYYSTS